MKLHLIHDNLTEPMLFYDEMYEVSEREQDE